MERIMNQLTATCSGLGMTLTEIVIDVTVGKWSILQDINQTSRQLREHT